MGVYCAQAGSNMEIQTMRLFVTRGGQLSALSFLLGWGYQLSGQVGPFPTLQTGYTQELFGTATLASGAILGGLTFAPSGDVWAKICGPVGALLRFDAARTLVVNGANLHIQTTGATQTASGCGLTVHPDGRLYLNSVSGAQRIDATTGAALGVIGQPGNIYGITVDPQTNRVVYPAGNCVAIINCRLLSVDPVSGNVETLATFAAPAALEFVDGIAFDPAGNFLVVVGRTGSFPQDRPYLTILTRSGTTIRQLSADHFPDGVAFHQSPFYMITNNNDGTVRRYDFPGDDLRQMPAETVDRKSTRLNSSHG